MDFNLDGVSVMLAMPVNRDLPWQTAKSLIETVTVFEKNKIKFEVQLVVGSSIVEVARTKVANTFLSSKMNRLFMLDSDMSWTPDDALRMLALSTRMSVVVGPYTAKRDPPTYLLLPETNEVEMNECGCIPVRGHGLGFTIVHREVIEQLAAKAPLVSFDEFPNGIPHIFRCDVVDGNFRGEDMAFFADAKDAGHTVWMDPSLKLGHVGGKEYRGDLMTALKRI